ncbi:hypothetical protein [Litorivivens sp.]|uniref:hypothetical protein n=1 Tax=Litorivivens sp. TaxID=2020868 RepID=UPI003563ADD5
MNKQHLMITSLTLLITACGGGGGGGGEEAATPAEQNTAPVAPLTEETTSVVTVPTEAATTSELMVPAGYDLGQDYNLTVTASAQSFSANTAYLSICTGFVETNPGAFDVDYDSCLIQTNMAPSTTTSMAVPADADQVLAVVLLLDEPAAPIYRVWQSTGEQDQYWAIQ